MPSAEPPDQVLTPWQRVYGRGVYPHQHARALLNPLRALIFSRRQLLARLALRPAMRVLELGPGPGYFSVALARAIPDGQLVLVDIQPEMLDRAVARLVAAGQTNFVALAGNALALPLDDAQIDVAALVTVLGEVGDPARCLLELRRVLKPRGCVSVTELPGDPDRVPRAALEALAAASGLEPAGAWGGRHRYTLSFRRPG